MLMQKKEVHESEDDAGMTTASRADVSRRYFRRLYDFVVTLSMRLHSPFLSSLHDHLPPACIDALPDYPNSQPYLPSMVSYKNIHMTDKTFDPENKFIQSWAETNSKDGWRINFLDDQQAQDWVEMNFRRTDVEWAWNFMHRGVLKADFLRYLLPLVQGGVYSDVDVSHFCILFACASAYMQLLRLAPSGRSSNGVNSM